MRRGVALRRRWRLRLCVFRRSLIAVFVSIFILVLLVLFVIFKDTKNLSKEPLFFLLRLFTGGLPALGAGHGDSRGHAPDISGGRRLGLGAKSEEVSQAGEHTLLTGRLFASVVGLGS